MWGASTPLVSTKSRAPAPRLSAEHLNAARSVSVSNASTQSTNFLSPFTTGTPNLSPPPRQEADDYLSVHGPSHHKRKPEKKQETRRNNTPEATGKSRSIQRSLASGLQSGSSNGSGCDVSAAKSLNSDAGTTYDAPLTKSIDQLYHRSHSHSSKHVTAVDAAHVQTWPKSAYLKAATLKAATNVPDSSAVNALRNLSQPLPADSSPLSLRKMSSTFARTFSFFKPQPTTPDTTVDSIEAGKKPDELSRKNSANHTSVANHNSDQQRPTSEDGKDLPGNLGTPASITLRKASNAYADSQAKTSMSASLVFESERDRPSDAPASELLAFYSTSTSHGKKSVSSEPLSAENVKAPQDSKIISPSDTKYTSPSRRGSKSIMQFSSSRRSSFPAETTLTFADVHLAPGTFPKSRKSSLMLEDCPRRISFVQFRSRDSVHEVIWRENERTSGSSLVSSSGTSGNPQFQSRSGTASPDCQESLTQTFGTIATVDSGILPLIPSLVKPQVNLFQWSWDKTSQSIAANAGKFGPPSDPLGQISVASASDPVLTSPRKPSNLDTPKYRRPSVPEGLYVQPFPPLRPLRAHSSTDEWRKAPLVGLNGSLASRLVPFGTQASVDENGIGGNWQNGATKETDTEGEDNNGLQTSSKFWRPSSQPRAPARLGASGTVGFNIPE